MMKIETEYKGYTVEWHDRAYFMIYLDGKEIKRNIRTLGECEKWIDKKTKQKFKRVSIITSFGWNRERKTGEATSIVDGEEVWVVSGTDRNKKYFKDVWLDTPENRAILRTIKDLKEEIKRVSGEITDAEESAERLTPEHMVIK